MPCAVNQVLDVRPEGAAPYILQLPHALLTDAANPGTYAGLLVEFILWLERGAMSTPPFPGITWLTCGPARCRYPPPLAGVTNIPLELFVGCRFAAAIPERNGSRTYGQWEANLCNCVWCALRRSCCSASKDAPAGLCALIFKLPSTQECVGGGCGIPFAENTGFSQKCCQR